MSSQEKPPIANKPGAISLFFVVKAGIFAAAFWIWLLVLALSDGPVTGWYIFAAAGAITTTLVGVVLGARMALASTAAEQYAESKRMLVEISWNTAFNASGADEASDNVFQLRSAANDSGGWTNRPSGAPPEGNWPNRPEGGDRYR